MNNTPYSIANQLTLTGLVKLATPTEKNSPAESYQHAEKLYRGTQSGASPGNLIQPSLQQLGYQTAAHGAQVSNLFQGAGNAMRQGFQNLANLGGESQFQNPNIQPVDWEAPQRLAQQGLDIYNQAELKRQGFANQLPDAKTMRDLAYNRALGYNTRPTLQAAGRRAVSEQPNTLGGLLDGDAWASGFAAQNRAIQNAAQSAGRNIGNAFQGAGRNIQNFFSGGNSPAPTTATYTPPSGGRAGNLRRR